MKRYLEADLKKDLGKKILLLSGPRQVGKTTLTKNLKSSYEYLNYDSTSDRKRIHRLEWDNTKELLILDELHKMPKWKGWLKGICDTQRSSHLIVTGSAKLDTFKKVGDSMAGRYFQFHLMPLDLKELGVIESGNAEKQMERLLNLSGFPEPYLANSEPYYKRWQKTHLDIILRQDLIEEGSLKRITDIELLVELMRARVAATFSYNSLKEDLRTDDKSIKRWMLALENAYVFFKLTPYSKNLKTALNKTPKYYFFDVPRVIDPGARFENFVALSLYKEILYRNDVMGERYTLHYLRTKQQKEIDFLICNDNKPISLIEAKLSEEKPSSHFAIFEDQLKKLNPKISKIQIVKNLKRSFDTREGVRVAKASEWLKSLEF